jgi:hypothetical protein
MEILLGQWNDGAWTQELWAKIVFDWLVSFKNKIKLGCTSQLMNKTAIHTHVHGSGGLM